ncbi:MAG: hypothetical protein ACRC20_00120 [Segniliparus sp.]|uniref:hypothetical protein n=1 Tax=Segniliparus sp. TaxID=2804064 RepID=UPI003F2B9E4C
MPNVLAACWTIAESVLELGCGELAGGIKYRGDVPANSLTVVKQAVTLEELGSKLRRLFDLLDDRAELDRLALRCDEAFRRAQVDMPPPGMLAGGRRWRRSAE